jgi:hypothetical protein
MDPAYPLLGAMAFSLILLQINQRVASPLISIVNRWLRWFIFSFGAAYVITEFSLIDRPYWVLVCICFLLWFLLETLYNWMAISALSLSPLPLFPRYGPNPGGDEWPMQPRILRIRDWLRAAGFRPIQALRAEIAAGIHMRVSVYDSADSRIRVQLMFLPEANGAVSLSCVLVSLTEDGRRIMTDNLRMPFGGFYPEHWEVVRKPWTRSISNLLVEHSRRLAAQHSAVLAIEQDPYSDICMSQSELDRFNTELGFLVPQGDREELGKITYEGKYRVWKEIWMLDYLGRCARHS